MEQLRRRRVPLGAVERHVQHGLVVPDEHQLAVLRRRDDDDLLQPDGRADGAELRLGRGRHRRRGRADPRHRRPQRQEPRQLLQDLVRTILYVLLPLVVHQRARAGLAGLDPELLALRLACTGSAASRRRSRWGRSPRRRRSRCSAPTAAASSTSTPRTRSRTRTASRTSSRCCMVLVIPAALVFTYGQDGRLAPPGDRDLRDDVRDVPRRRDRRLRRRGARLAGAARGRPAHAGDRRLDRRQPRGQGAALRHRRLGAVRRRHDRHLVRRGQQLDRVLHRASAARSRSPTCRPAR